MKEQERQVKLLIFQKGKQKPNKTYIKQALYSS
jgi:hypothetical protein